METELETLWVRFKGDSTGYEWALRRAIDETRKAASQMKSALGPSASSSIFSDMVGATKAMSGLVVSAVESTLSGVFGLLSNMTRGTVSGVTWFFDQFAKGAQHLIDTESKARSLGMTVTELRAAMEWGGTSAKAMPEILGSVTQKLAQARTGVDMARRDMTVLANVSGVKSMATDFAGVVEQLSLIENKATRDALTFQIMGDKAGDVLRQLNDKDGMSKAGGAIKSMGLEVSPSDMAAIRSVMDSLRQLGMLIQGVWNQIMVGLAPFLAEMGKLFDPKKADLSWIKEAVSDVVRALGYVGVFAIEATKNVALIGEAFAPVGAAAIGVFHQIKAAFLDMIGSMSVAMLKQVDLTGGLFKGLGIITEDTHTKILKHQLKTLSDEADKARAAAGSSMRDAATLGTALGKKLSGTDSGKALDEWMTKAKDSFKGMKDEFKSPFDVPSFTMIRRQLDSIRDSAKGAGEKFKESMTQLILVRDEFSKKGLAGLAGDSIGVSAYNNAQQLINSMGTGSIIGLASAAEYQTREAQSAMTQYAMLGERGTIEDQIVEALNAANQQRIIQMEMGERVLTVIESLPELLQPVGS